MGRLNSIMIFGAILAILGIIGFAIPVFTTQQTKDVAKIGDLKIQATESTSHVVPPLVAGGLLAVGVVLLGVGFYRRN